MNKSCLLILCILFTIRLQIKSQSVVYKIDTAVDFKRHFSVTGTHGLCSLNDSLLIILQQDEYANRSVLIKKRKSIEISVYNIKSKNTFSKFLALGANAKPESFIYNEDIVADNGIIYFYYANKLLSYKYENIDTLPVLQSVDFVSPFHINSHPRLRGVFGNQLYYTIDEVDSLYSVDLTTFAFNKSEALCKGNNYRQYISFNNISMRKGTIISADPLKLSISVIKNSKLFSTIKIDSALFDTVTISYDRKSVWNAFQKRTYVETIGFITDDMFYVKYRMREPEKPSTLKTAYVYITNFGTYLASNTSDYCNNGDKRWNNPACMEQPLFLYNNLAIGNKLYMLKDYYSDYSCQDSLKRSLDSRIMYVLTIEEYLITIK